MRGRLILRITVSGWLAASGLLMIWAEWLRWWPACRFGGFDAAACIDRQDAIYMLFWPEGELTTFAWATELAGVSLLLLAVAIALLPFVLVGPHPGRVTLWMSWVMSASVLILAAVDWLSARAGHAVNLPGHLPAAFTYLLGGSSSCSPCRSCPPGTGGCATSLG